MRKRLSSLAQGRPKAPESFLYGQTTFLLNIYLESQNRLSAILTKGNVTSFQRFRANELLRQIRVEIKLLNEKVGKWSNTAVSKAYERGQKLTAKLASEYKIAGAVDYGNVIHTQAIGALASQVVFDFLSANNSIQNNIGRYIRRSQQMLLRDQQISRLVARGIIEGETRIQTTDALLGEFQKRMGKQQFIVVNGRNYRPEHYAELVVRTRTTEAVSQGMINSALDCGMDLIQIDVHSDACPICQTRMGRIFSISGANSSFPVLVSYPPYHVFCRCHAFPVTRLALERDGVYEQMSKLSKGTPNFSKAKEAEKWLGKNEHKRLTTLQDFKNYAKTGDRRGKKVA